MADTRTAIAEWFERSGYTQRKAAGLLGITEQHMSHLVAGRRQASLPLAVKISELTGIPVSALIVERPGDAA